MECIPSFPANDEMLHTGVPTLESGQPNRSRTALRVMHTLTSWAARARSCLPNERCITPGKQRVQQGSETQHPVGMIGPHQIQEVHTGANKAVCAERFPSPSVCQNNVFSHGLLSYRVLDVHVHLYAPPRAV